MKNFPMKRDPSGKTAVSETKVRIFHVCQNFYPVWGGIESFVYESSKELIKKGYDVTVIASDRMPTTGARTGKRLPARERIDGIKVFRFPFKRFSRYSTSVEALKFILSSDFDILHIHGIGFFSDAIPLVKFRADKKVVLSTHGGIFHTQAMMSIKNIYFKTMVKIAGKFADRIIAVSEQDRKFMEKITDKKKIVVIRNGVDWKSLSKIERSGNGRTLLYVGRIAANKKIERILHMVQDLKGTLPNVFLYVVGEDWGELNELKLLTKRLDIAKNVKFTGSISKGRLRKIFSKSDMFLLASDYEGFGISVIEAMSAGIPVVVNDIDSMKEIVKNGINGFRVNFKNHAETSRIIAKALRNKKTMLKVGNSARNYAKFFDWSRVIQDLERVYGELIV